MNGNCSVVISTTEVLTVCFCCVSVEKLSDIFKSLGKGKYITATMRKENVKQITFNLLKPSDLDDLH